MWLSFVKAFLVGGALCTVGQVLIDRTRLTPARILTGYVVTGVLLSATGLYGPLVRFAGCGAGVPLTGFGHLIAQGVRQAVSEQGLIGALTGPFTAASGGIAAALLSGLLCALLFRSRPKAA